jgi:hypothetical protein
VFNGVLISEDDSFNHRVIPKVETEVPREEVSSRAPHCGMSRDNNQAFQCCSTLYLYILLSFKRKSILAVPPVILISTLL